MGPVSSELRKQRARLFASCLLAASCEGGAREVDEATPIAMEVAGCALETRDGACHLEGERALSLFVPAPFGEELRVEAAGRALDVTAHAVDGGTLARVRVPDDASQLTLHARAPEGEGRAGLRVVTLREAPALHTGLAQKRAGELDQARATLTAALPTLTGLDEARALSALARVELMAGRNEQAVARFREALARDRALGLASSEMADATALSFLLTTRLVRLAEAQAVLDEARAGAERTADGRARFPYFEGLLAFELGDLRGALAAFRASSERSSRLGLALHAFTARDRIAAVLDALGRSDEASAELDALTRLDDAALSACERADALVNAAWVEIDRPGATRAELDAARARLERALRVLEGGCDDGQRRAIASTNLAYAALGLGDLAAARRELAAARAVPGAAEESLALWWLDLAGRIALGDGDARAALSAFARAEERARALGLVEAAWRARTGSAAAFELSGDLASALAAFESAEALLDGHADDAPLGEGRAAFLARHALSAQGAVELALAQKQPARALESARRARRRLVRALTQAAQIGRFDRVARARWTEALERYRTGKKALRARAEGERDLPLDELERARVARLEDERALTRAFEAELAHLAPAGDDARDATAPGLTLVYQRLRTGWVGFAVEGERVAARPLGPAPTEHTPEADAAWLLAPFTRELARASALRVLADGALRGLDFHALPFAGAPLLARMTVSYPLDLDRSPSRVNNHRALLIADPARDLPASRREADAVGRELARAGLRVARLEGDEATFSALAPELAQASHVHFAGHAYFAGYDGWDSALGLARGERLSLGDVLSSDVAADSVVLAGCEAAQAGRGERAALNIADGFALAGAQVVIAPTRPVDDRATAELMDELYRSMAEGAPDFGAGLRRAQLALSARDPGADWAAFRVITR